MTDYLEKYYADLKAKVRNAEFISLGNGTPFEIIETSTCHESYKAYLRTLLIKGRKSIMNKFMKYREQHAIDIEVRMPTMDYALAGDFVDIGRFMSGEPECMVSYHQELETQFVDFYINIDVCLGVGTENSFAYYAAALSVVDSLEQSNYRVKLIGVNYSNAVDKGKVYEVTTTIKDYSEPINYAYLTSICMAQTPFFKAIMYRPGFNLYNYSGCDYLYGFEPNVALNDNSFYAPSLFGKNRFGKDYSALGQNPEAFAFSELIQDWKLDHLLAKNKQQ